MIEIRGAGFGDDSEGDYRFFRFPCVALIALDVLALARFSFGAIRAAFEQTREEIGIAYCPIFKRRSMSVRLFCRVNIW